MDTLVSLLSEMTVSDLSAICYRDHTLFDWRVAGLAFQFLRKDTHFKSASLNKNENILTYRCVVESVQMSV